MPNKYLVFNGILRDICTMNGSNKKIAERYGRTPAYVNSLRKKVESLRYEPRIGDGELLCCYKCGISEREIDSSWIFHHNHKTLEWIAIVCRKCNRELEAEISLIPKKLDLSLNHDQLKEWRLLMKEFNEKDLKSFIAKFPKHYNKIAYTQDIIVPRDKIEEYIELNKKAPPTCIGCDEKMHVEWMPEINQYVWMCDCGDFVYQYQVDEKGVIVRPPKKEGE